MSGPNLDEQIELMKAEFYASDLSPKSFDLTIGIRTKMLVANQVAEAEKQGALNALTQLKVDYVNEWVGIDPKTMGLKTAPLTYQAIIEDRIAQLRSTK